MDSSGLRTPSPNKEFRRVSSRNINSIAIPSADENASKSRTTGEGSSPKSGIGKGSGRFSPSQYLGRSLTKQSTVRSNAGSDESVGSSKNGAVDRLQKPLQLSQHELREARRDRQNGTMEACRSENFTDYIGLSPSNAAQARSPSNQRTPQNRSATEGRDLSSPVDETESPPPPPPRPPTAGFTPPSAPLPLDEMRRIKDAADGLFYHSRASTNASMSGIRNGDASPSFDRHINEDEDRLRRFRRIQAMQQDYHSAIETATAQCAVDASQLFFPTTNPTSSTVQEAREAALNSMLQWCALHTNAEAVVGEQINALSVQRTQHGEVQQQVLSSETKLAAECTEHNELLVQLQQAVAAAESRRGVNAVQSVLQHYPRSWFAPVDNNGAAAALGGGRSRSNSVTSTQRSVSRERSGSTARAATPSSRSGAPTRRYDLTGAGTTDPSGGTVDPTLMPAGDQFSQPWRFQIRPDILEGLAAATAAGPGIYGPPAQERRYASLEEVACDATVLTGTGTGTFSRSTSASRSRSGSATRSRSGTFSSAAGYSSIGAGGGDLSTLGGGNSVRSTSASRARSAHIQAMAQKSPNRHTPQPFKNSPSQSDARVVSGTERYLRGLSASRSPSAPRYGTAAPVITNVFTASGERYQSEDEDAARASLLQEELTDNGTAKAPAYLQHEHQKNGYADYLQDQRAVGRDKSPSRRPSSATRSPAQDMTSPARRTSTTSPGRRTSAAPDIVYPRNDRRASLQSAAAAASGTPAQTASPTQGTRPGLARTPSNSAASTRFYGDGNIAPVDISQVRPGTSYNGVMRRPSSSSTDTSSYAGSRHSDIQWDAAGRIVRTGHRNAVTAAALQQAVAVVDEDSQSELEGETGAFELATEAEMRQELPSPKAEMTRATPTTAVKQQQVALSQSSRSVGQSLIRGVNNRDLSDRWHVSSSEDGDGDNDALPSIAVEAASQSTAAPYTDAYSTHTYSGEPAAPASAARRGITIPVALGNFASPLRRSSVVARDTSSGPWSPSTSTSNAPPPSPSHQSPAGAGNNSTNVKKPQRRPSVTPKVRVPAASQASLTPEGQLAYLTEQVAERDKADEYIASLKRMVIK